MRFSRAATASIVVVGVLLGSMLAPAAAQGGKPDAPEVGITDKEIRVAIIADVDNPVVPGLFQGGVDAVRAWARLVNKKGGIAGRKVVVDFSDSRISQDEVRKGVIKACAEDFALVGTEAVFFNNADDMVACKDAQGKPTGLPDIPGVVNQVAERCAPVTYSYAGDGTFCPTKDQHPQTYHPQRGDARYYLSKEKNLHGIFLLPSDLKASRNLEMGPFQAAVDLGIKKDGEGFYESFAMSTQSAITPFVQVIKDNNSTFAYNGNSNKIMVLLRREAKLQGADSVKIWACNQDCYKAEFLEQGGADVEGTHTILTTLPFFSEYKLNPTLKALARELGGPDKVDANAINAFVAAQLFEEAAKKAAATGKLTRQSLLDALKSIHDFDAQGIIGPQDVGNHQPQQCIVMAVVKNGKWVREHPTKPGTFDCSKKNLTELKLDLP